MEQHIADKEKEGEDQQLYDLVCCSEVVEHVENQRDFLKNCMKLVKPKTGHLFMSTIAKTPEAYFLTILSKPYFINPFSGRVCD